ncbi:MAG: hypothetical protein MZU95_14185 [Desulfomicrobium escambiense]|nr:hypothetical protein [Desulfomicrobium escambiense]
MEGDFELQKRLVQLYRRRDLCPEGHQLHGRKGQAARPGGGIRARASPPSQTSCPGFFDVSTGRSSCQGTDIRDVTLKSLRENIAMVTQEMILFNDTIRANIAYGTVGLIHGRDH